MVEAARGDRLLSQDILFAEHLRVATQLAYRWQPLEVPVDAAMLERVDHHNAHVLQTVLALQEHFPESAEYSVDYNLELARLDLKINLLFELISELIHKQIKLPARTNLTLSAYAARWRQMPAVDADSVGLLSIYFHPSLPKPVDLVVAITQVQAVEHGYEVSGLFQGTSLGVKEQLEKLIFRLHRKAIARSRTAT
jgi:hypothetical protein